MLHTSFVSPDPGTPHRAGADLPQRRADIAARAPPRRAGPRFDGARGEEVTERPSTYTFTFTCTGTCTCHVNVNVHVNVLGFSPPLRQQRGRAVARVAHARLEFRVGVLPQLGKAGVVPRATRSRSPRASYASPGCSDRRTRACTHTLTRGTCTPGPTAARANDGGMRPEGCTPFAGKATGKSFRTSGAAPLDTSRSAP